MRLNDTASGLRPWGNDPVKERHTPMMTPDIRWKQRFQNFERGYLLLCEALEQGPARLSALEKEGVIQRFEYTFELAWKTVKDYLEHEGLTISPLTPREVIKQGYAAQVLEEGQTWIEMLDHRNLLSHTYDFSTFEKAVEAIHGIYLPELGRLHAFLEREGRK
jgi:nucleotidyltransferase substrate binding protein (TIGR01987 family)